MILFYAPDIIDSTYSLSEEESKHCQRVLRLQAGDTIHLTNGQGTLFEARIFNATSRQVSVEIVKKLEHFGKRPYRLHLAVAPTKNTDRFEWFLEKSTEIGIDEITPLICEHSERRHLRTDRLEKIITAAMKQSLKAYHPKLNQPFAFKDFLKERHPGQLFIAHLQEDNPIPLQNLYQRGNDTIIMIGPEGDFSPEEIKQANQSGYQIVSLGNSRLRTETAAIVACHTVLMLNV